MLEEGQRRNAEQLRATLHKLLAENIGSVGTVSYITCEDIIAHHERDLNRLIKLHHQQTIEPSKHIGYLVFWVRKLKPISAAYPISLLTDNVGNLLPGSTPVLERHEVISINELVSIYLAQHLMLLYAHLGKIKREQQELSESERNALKNNMIEIIKGILTSHTDAGHAMGNVFDAFVYDMRYRTFGPHHVVHFVNHVIYAALKRI